LRTFLVQSHSHTHYHGAAGRFDFRKPLIPQDGSTWHSACTVSWLVHGPGPGTDVTAVAHMTVASRPCDARALISPEAI